MKSITVSPPLSFTVSSSCQFDVSTLTIFLCSHLVLKEHPYRKLAHSIRAWESLHPGDRVQVIGMSASLTYAVEDQAVQDVSCSGRSFQYAHPLLSLYYVPLLNSNKTAQKALNALCQDLAITKMICPSAKDLEDGGYSPKDDSIQTIHKPWRVPEGVIPGKKYQGLPSHCHRYSQK